MLGGARRPGEISALTRFGGTQRLLAEIFVRLIWQLLDAFVDFVEVY
jgi:hypothetical protein